MSDSEQCLNQLELDLISLSGILFLPSISSVYMTTTLLTSVLYDRSVQIAKYIYVLRFCHYIFVLMKSQNSNLLFSTWKEFISGDLLIAGTNPQTRGSRS